MSEITDNYSQISKDIEQSSNLIGVQLQSVDSSLLDAFISVIVTSFLSKEFGLLLYWIPVSFFLMWILLMFSFIWSQIQGRKVQLEPKKVKQNSPWSSEQGLFLLLASFKNALPFFKTIGVIFFVSFLSLVIKQLNVIGKGVNYSPVLPVISTLLFFSLPILNNKAISDLEKNRVRLGSMKLTKLNWIIIFFYIFVYVGALLVMPVLSLIALKSVYITSPSVILPILLVIFLQIIAAITFMNYFSAMSVKKEMTLALSRLSTIQHHINDTILNATYNKANYTLLKNQILRMPAF